MRRHQSANKIRHIGASLIPTVAFVAVPAVPDQINRLSQENHINLSSLLVSSRFSQHNEEDQDIVEEMSDSGGYDRLSRITDVPGRKISKDDLPRFLKEDESDKSSNADKHVYSIVRKPKRDSSRNNFQLATGIAGDSPRRNEESSRPISRVALQHSEPIEVDLEAPVVMRERPVARRRRKLSPAETGTVAADVRGSKDTRSEESESLHPIVNHDSDNKDEVVDRLRREMNTLKDTVRRLTVELGKCQTSSDKKSRAKDQFLPGKGPIPPWLISTRYLSPLLSVYDEKLEQNERVVRAYEGEIRRIETTIGELVKENERLHLKLEESEAVKTKTSRSEWEEFMIQAKLVLEENYLLLAELDVQQEKMKQIQREYLTEVGELSKKVILLESEKSLMENELFKVKHDLSDSESQHEKLTSTFDKIESETTDQIQGLQKVIGKRKENNSSRMKEMMEKLANLQREKKKLAEQLSDCKTDKSKLKLEAKESLKQLKTCEKKYDVLKQMLDKEISAQEYLADVIGTATTVANERDKYLQTARNIENKYTRKLNQMIEDIQLKTSVKGRKTPHLHTPDERHPLSNLKTTVDELILTYEEEKQKSEDRQREIKYLQSLIQEKEKQYELLNSDKKELENSLTAVWNTHLKD